MCKLEEIASPFRRNQKKLTRYSTVWEVDSPRPDPIILRESINPYVRPPSILSLVRRSSVPPQVSGQCRPPTRKGPGCKGSGRIYPDGKRGSQRGPCGPMLGRTLDPRGVGDGRRRNSSGGQEEGIGWEEGGQEEW